MERKKNTKRGSLPLTHESARMIRTRESGFTVLLAALIASLVLSLGISVFTIAQKQLLLSSMGRNSQYAFYAADTASECALYWDIRKSRFAPSATGNIICDEDSAAVTYLSGTPEIYQFQFEPNGYCAKVQVEKKATNPRTKIIADGYSVVCSEINTSSRVLQRSVELTY